MTAQSKPYAHAISCIFSLLQNALQTQARLVSWVLPRSTCRCTQRTITKLPRSWGSQSGFTILELLVTLALLGLSATLCIPYMSARHGAAGLAADARVLASYLRAARETALTTRTNTTVTIDLIRPGLRDLKGWSDYHFATAERVSVINAKGKVMEQSALITFGPDGSSNGGLVILEGAARLYRVKVEWLTGTVSMSEALQ